MCKHENLTSNLLYVASDRSYARVSVYCEDCGEQVGRETVELHGLSQAEPDLSELSVNADDIDVGDIIITDDGEEWKVIE